MTTPATASLTLPVGERDHVRGPATALVTLVEYGDYECSYCGEAYPVVEELRRALGDRVQPRAVPNEQAQLVAEPFVKFDVSLMNTPICVGMNDSFRLV